MAPAGPAKPGGGASAHPSPPPSATTTSRALLALCVLAVAGGAFWAGRATAPACTPCAAPLAPAAAPAVVDAVTATPAPVAVAAAVEVEAGVSTALPAIPAASAPTAEAPVTAVEVEVPAAGLLATETAALVATAAAAPPAAPAPRSIEEELAALDALPVPPSYLVPDASEDHAHLRRLLAALHAQQHPPKAECASRRLLVTQFSPKSFEGIGSILKLLVQGLGEAAHANRTLVWGLDLPYVYEHTRELWHEEPPVVGGGGDGGSGDGGGGVKSARRKRKPAYGPQPPRPVTVNGVQLECSGWRGLGGGPFTCFFEPLSSCSLDDVSPEELHAMGAGNGHTDGARVRIQEARRGPGAYHPPRDAPLFRAVFAAGGRGGAGLPAPPLPNPRHTWAAALGAYAFRLKPALHAALEAHRQEVWRGAGVDPGAPRALPRAPHGDGDGEQQQRQSPPVVWGLHVRHGDVTALADVYGNRRVYAFPEYFDAARARARALAAEAWPSSSGGPAPPRWLQPPHALFVASDDPDTSAHVESQAGAGGWPALPAGGPPTLFTVNASLRYRTPHGSHTVAADGGCVRDVCAMHATDIIAYRVAAAKEGVPRHDRIMRVLLESVADLFLLSHVDHLVSQGSSHFSTMALLLLWARSGGRGALGQHTFLDEALIAEGIVQCSFLHGSLNGTASVPPGLGHLRWESHTRRFVEGLGVGPRGAATQGTELPVGGPDLRLSLVEGLPLFPGDVFYREAARWGGALETPPGHPPPEGGVWPGECPLPALPGRPTREYVAELVNHGADHSDLHPSQAHKCWAAAAAMVDAARQPGAADPLEPSAAAHLLDVVQGNMHAQQAAQSFPYSMRKGDVARFLRMNLGPQHPAVDNAAFLRMR